MDWDGLWYATHRDVYEPADDTFLLARCVAEAAKPGMRWLDVGTGTGVVAMAAARAGAQVVATDANPIAADLALRNARENDVDVACVVADLMAGVAGPFDGVSFNPPYLPTGPDDKVQGPLNLAFDGGPSGNDVVLRLVEQIRAAARPPTLVLVVHSTLSDPHPMQQAMADAGYAVEVAASERHFYEELTVQRFYRR